MGLVNPGTEFNEDGWADVISELRRLRLMVEGGGNDLNNQTKEVTQKSDEFLEVEVEVCTDEGEKTMKVMGTQPQ